MIKLNLFPVPVRFHSGTGKLKSLRYFNIFAIFKNVVHSLEPGETPSNSKLCATSLNITKTLRCGCVYFFNILKTSSVTDVSAGNIYKLSEY